MKFNVYFLSFTWFISLATAFYVGYLMRPSETTRHVKDGSVGHRDIEFDRRRLPSDSTQDSREARTSRPAKKKTQDPYSWPAGVPENGPELRDHIANILRSDDCAERTIQYLTLLRCANKDNVQEFCAGWDQLRREGVWRGEIEQAMNFRLGELDGPHSLSGRKGSDHDLGVIGGVGVQWEGWNKSDPEAAQAWIENLPDSQFRTAMLERAVVCMASEKPSEVTALLSQLPEEMQISAAAQMISRMRDHQGLDKTLDWLSEQKVGAEGKPPGWAEGAVSFLLDGGTGSRFSAPGIALALEKQIASPFATTDRLLNVAKSFVKKNPKEALDWALRVEGLGSPKANSGQLLTVLIESVDSDRLNEIEGWLNSQLEAPRRNDVIKLLSQKYKEISPEKSEYWGNQIKN
jgi:hypothetical protein